MILDKTYNAKYYLSMHPLFPKAMEFLEAYLENPVPAGIYEICGKDLFVKVQDYETRENGFLEVHDHYIDVQCMIAGTEKVYYTERKGLEPACDYDENEDALFLQDRNGCIEFLFHGGEIAIFFPWDAHKPAMCVGEKTQAKKLVFKVKI